MDKIIEILKGIRPACAISEDTRLLDDKILDSMAMISLVSELSDAFDIDITATDVVPENFGTPKAIAALVKRLEEEEE